MISALQPREVFYPDYMSVLFELGQQRTLDGEPFVVMHVDRLIPARKHT
jgi:hypothetical protein